MLDRNKTCHQIVSFHGNALFRCMEFYYKTDDSLNTFGTVNRRTINAYVHTQLFTNATLGNIMYYNWIQIMNLDKRNYVKTIENRIEIADF